MSALRAVAETAIDPLYRAARRLARTIGFRYEILYRHLRRHPARNILEIGVYRGIRSREFVRASLTKLPPAEVHFYGIDLFEQYSVTQRGAIEDEFAELKPPLSQAEIHRLLADLLPSENIHLYAGRSGEVFANQGSELPPMDFVFIDGGHSLATIREDFEHCARLLARGGSIFIDDVWLSRAAGGRRLFQSLSPRQWEKRLYPIPDFFKDTVGFIWLARVRRKE